MEIISMDKFFAHLKDNGEVFASKNRIEKGNYTVSFFHLTEYQQSHPGYWELHPNGDELIFLSDGKLQAECVSTPGSESELPAPGDIRQITISRGQAIIIPKGFWHRLLMVEESKIIVITKIEGTRRIPV